jgi:hypothetical protein
VDVAAELTMWIAQYLQTGAEAPRSALQWVFVPSPRRRSYVEAREWLATAPKPAVVGVLHQLGHLGNWRMAALDEDETRKIEAHVRDQQAFLDAALARSGAAGGDHVVFEGWGDRLAVPVAELRRWSREYVVVCGWTLMPAGNAGGPLRFVVSHGSRFPASPAVCIPRAPGGT